MLRHPLAGERLREARPAASRIELALGVEERLAAGTAPICAVRVLVPVLPGEGALRPLLAHHVVLLGRQLLPPLGVGFLDLLVGYSPASR